MIKLTGRATGNHNTGLYIKHLFKTYIHAIILHFARRRGGGGRWSSLHESTSVCPPLLISAPCTDFTTYIFCTITLLFALSKHTHTQAQDHYLALPILTSTRTLYIFALSTPAEQDHFPPGHDTVKIIALCTIGSDPFLYLETLCVNMFSLCVCICDLCMYVGEVYTCIYVYKILDDLNFPLN